MFFIGLVTLLLLTISDVHHNAGITSQVRSAEDSQTFYLNSNQV